MNWLSNLFAKKGLDRKILALLEADLAEKVGKALDKHGLWTARVVQRNLTPCEAQGYTDYVEERKNLLALCIDYSAPESLARAARELWGESDRVTERVSFHTITLCDEKTIRRKGFKTTTHWTLAIGDYLKEWCKKNERLLISTGQNDAERRERAWRTVRAVQDLWKIRASGF